MVPAILNPQNVKKMMSIESVWARETDSVRDQSNYFLCLLMFYPFKMNQIVP